MDMSSNKITRSSVSSVDSDARSISSVLAEVTALVDAGNVERALQLVKSVEKSSDAAINARCVCLMRLGRSEEARDVMRGVVIPQGCTWLKTESPVSYRTNFCLALFLSGHPGGCQSLLLEMKEQDHPSVQRVRHAIENWKRSLTFWQRLQWAVGLEPEARVFLDFVPGEFVEPFSAPKAAASSQASSSRPASQAV
jgi:Flp pilus assembly protein TadD